MRNGTTTAISPDAECDRYWSSKNFKIYRVFSAFGGLLDCFLLDFSVFLGCILVFSVLRKRAWNYGRIGVHRRLEEGDLGVDMQAYNVWTTMFMSDKPNKERNSFDKKLIQEDEGLFTWIGAAVKIKNKDIYKRCGPDALQYLTFQKYLIAYQVVVTIVSLVIVLPVNFLTGTYEGTKDTFARTTIINMHPDSTILWIHCALGLFLLCVAIGFMRHFMEHVNYSAEEESKSVMIRGIPKDKCYTHLLDIHFEEAYPECEVADIHFAFNVQHLVNLDFYRQNAKAALQSSQSTEEETGERPRIVPFHCGAVVNQCCRCRCCEACGWIQVDAIDYYKGQLEMYQELCDAEKVNAFHDPLGIAFVSFVHVLMAQRVIRDFRMTCKGRHTPQVSSMTRMLRVRDWTVVSAPPSGDIFWHNLTVGPALWWLRALAVNLVVLLIVIFCTTPSVFLNQLNKIKGFETETQSNLVLQFTPSLLLTISSAILPVIVSCSDISLVGHYTRSSLYLAVMVKVFTFLLIMVLVLPSVGFSSVGTAMQWFASGKTDFKFRWNCIFVSNNCAFFVNYLMSTATIGIGLDILRLPDLMYYSLLWTFATSQAERPMIRKYITSDFKYGTYYAWILCNFSVNMAYSIISPLITVPGLVYLILKYYVDRHNLCFVFKSSKINRRIHDTAINFVMTSVFCQQLTVLSFIVLSSDKITGITVFAMVTLGTMFVMFCLGICFGKISLPKPTTDLAWKLQDPKFEVYDPEHQEKDEPRPSFVPPVLEDRDDDDDDDDEVHFPTNLAYVTSEVMEADEPDQPDDIRRKSSRETAESKSRRESLKKSSSETAENKSRRESLKKSSSETAENKSRRASLKKSSGEIVQNISRRQSLKNTSNNSIRQLGTKYWKRDRRRRGETTSETDDTEPPTTGTE